MIEKVCMNSLKESRPHFKLYLHEAYMGGAGYKFNVLNINYLTKK